MMKNLLLLVINIIIYLFSSQLYALPAFPGAEGMGASTVGGRGGTVYKVTNLNDSGAGSFRAACEASGARIVVFGVSGDIRLTARLEIYNPYITIAGQTSPGGISVSGYQFNIATHDVIVTHMRFRGGGADTEDSIDLWGPGWNDTSALVYNIIFDHCSVTWGVDETFSVTGGAENVTLQYCLIGAGSHSNSHSKGLMVSGKYEYDTSVSLYRNYFPGSNDRNPVIWNPFGSYQGDPVEDDNVMYVDAVNNVSYNWYHGNRPMMGGWRNHVNWIGNYSKAGPLAYVYNAYAAIDPTSPTGDDEYAFLYDSGNYGYDYATGLFGDGSEGQWLIDWNYTSTAASTGYRQSTRWSMDVSLTASSMTTTLAATIVSESGATVPITDAVDQQLKDDYTNTTGYYSNACYPSSLTYPDDWPTYSTANDNPTDSDNDGMADTTELTVFGTLSKDGTADSDSDGYTDIEEYLFYLAGYPPAQLPAITGGSIP